MTWLLIALLGPLLWSVCKQIDRYFLSRYFAHETLGALLMFSSLIGTVVLPVAGVIPGLLSAFLTRTCLFTATISTHLRNVRSHSD